MRMRSVAAHCHDITRLISKLLAKKSMMREENEVKRKVIMGNVVKLSAKKYRFCGYKSRRIRQKFKECVPSRGYEERRSRINPQLSPNHSVVESFSLYIQITRKGAKNNNLIEGKVKGMAKVSKREKRKDRSN